MIKQKNHLKRSEYVKSHRTIETKEKKLKKITFLRLIYLRFDECMNVTITFYKNGSCKINDKYTRRKRILNKDETSSFILELENLKIDKWQVKNQFDIIILDGESWELEIEYANGNKIQKEGKNSFPRNYHKIC